MVLVVKCRTTKIDQSDLGVMQDSLPFGVRSLSNPIGVEEVRQIVCVFQKSCTPVSELTLEEETIS